MADVAAQVRAKGRRPEVIPFGGSNAAGAQGYVEAGEELLAQLPGLTSAVVAVGSGGTMAGLVRALGAEHVLGVHCGAVPDPEQTVARLVDGLSGDQQTARLRLRLDQVGAGYSALTGQVREAMLAAARTEGIVLDPVYTGRAMAGLIAAVREGDVRPGERTVFLHTGGLPGLFGHPGALALASSLVDAQSERWLRASSRGLPAIDSRFPVQLRSQVNLLGNLPVSFRFSTPLALGAIHDPSRRCRCPLPLPR